MRFRNQKLSKRFISFLLVVLMTISSMLTTALAYDPNDPNDPILSATLTVTKDTTRTNIWMAEYEIIPKPDIPADSADVVIVLDRSHNMNKDKRFILAKQAVKDFSEKILAVEDTETRISIVTLSRGPDRLAGEDIDNCDTSVLVPFTQDVSEIISALDDPDFLPDTGRDYYPSMYYLEQALADATNNRRMVLYITGGELSKDTDDLKDSKDMLASIYQDEVDAGHDFQFYALGAGSHHDTLLKEYVALTGSKGGYIDCSDVDKIAPLIDKFGSGVDNTVKSTKAHFTVNAPFYIIDGPQLPADGVISPDGRRIDFKDFGVPKEGTKLYFEITLDYNGGEGEGGGKIELDVNGEFTYDKVDGGGGKDNPHGEGEFDGTLSNYTVKYIAKAGEGTIVGSEIESKETVKSGQNPKAVPDPKPKSTVSNEFKGWYLEDDTTTLLQKADIETMPILKNTKFTAVFGLKEYTVTYTLGENNTMGSATTIATETVAHNTNPKLAKDPVHHDPNMAFAGWLKNNTGSAISTTAVIGTKITANVEYVATYKLKTAAITYSVETPGTGTLTGTQSYTPELTKTIGVAAKPPVPNPTTGYDFVHWKVGSNTYSTEELEALTITGSMTIKAVFAKQKFKVNFDANSGALASGMLAEQEVAHGGSPTNVKDPTPPDESTKFKGWSTDNGATTVTSLDVLGHNITSPTTYKAIYETKTYKVSYNPNGGTFSGTTATKDETVNYGKNPVTFGDPKAPAKQVFVGWKEGTTMPVTTASIKLLEIKADKVFVAQYKADENEDGKPDDEQVTYTVTFNTDGKGKVNGSATVTYKFIGDTAPLKATDVVGGSFSIPTTTPNSGYVFKNWTPVLETNVADFRVTGNATYTANFIPDKNTVTYTVAPGSSSVTSEVVSLNAKPIKVIDPTPEKYFKFDGWKLQGDPTPSNVYSTDDVKTHSIDSPKTYIAQYSKKTATVNYVTSANGSISSPSSQTFDQGEKLGSKTIPTPTADNGYKFKHWLIGSTPYNANTIKDYFVEGDVTVTAVFEKEGYTVKYDLNGGKIGGNSTLADENVLFENSPTTISDPTPAKYFKFDGWKKGTESTLYTSDEVKTHKIDANVTYTAQYTQLTGKVTYVAGANGSIAPTTELTFNQGEKLSTQTIPTPTAENGYKFKEWMIGSTSYNTTTIKDYIVEGNVTVTAVFEKKGYTVAYDLNGGKLGTDSSIQAENVLFDNNPVGIANPIPPAKKAFVGWKEEDGTPISMDQIKAIKVSADLKFTAQYETDENEDGKPDLEQTTYIVKFVAGTNGKIDGTKTDITYKFIGDGTTLTIDDVVGGKASFAIPTTNPNANYLFQNWTPTLEMVLANFKVTEDTIYTANFVLSSNTVTYEKNGGTLTSDPSEVVNYSGSPIKVSDPTPPGDSLFTGWKRSPGGQIMSSDEVKADVINEAVTYTAQYNKKAAGVTYVSGEHGSITGETSFPSASWSDKVGDVTTLPTVTPDTGYEFSHWTVNGSGTYNDTELKAYVIASDSVTVTAEFRKQTYSVTYDLNGGTNGPANENVLFEESPLNTKDPAAPFGHIFAGWRTLDGRLISSDAVKAELIVANTNYVAEYSAGGFTVIYDPNGGILTCDPTESVIFMNRPQKVTDPLPAIGSKLAFDGWAKPESPILLSSDVVKLEAILGDITYIAQYAADENEDGIPDKYQYSYTLRFESNPVIQLNGQSQPVEFTVIGGDSRIGNTTVSLVGSAYAVPTTTTTSGQSCNAVWTSNPTGINPVGLNEVTTAVAVDQGDNHYLITFTPSTTFKISFYNQYNQLIGSFDAAAGQSIADAAMASTYAGTAVSYFQTKIIPIGANRFQGWRGSNTGNIIHSSAIVDAMIADGNLSFTAVVGRAGG